MHRLAAGWLQRGTLAILLAGAVLAPALAQQREAKPPLGCSAAQAVENATIAAVRDGRTLVTDDGREVRLAGLETPPDDTAAKAALTGLVAGRAVRLQSRDTDRYGRLVAYVFVDESQPSLQERLLEQGLARVSARIGAKTCAEALLTLERGARAAKRGLWADPNFAPLQSENLTTLQGERGRFALVEGKVLSVRESGATIYVNFGRRWTRDFTVIILKRQQRTFAAAGVEPKQLEGHRIRIRGWIEQRGGPVVMAEAPEQIELID